MVCLDVATGVGPTPESYGICIGIGGTASLESIVSSQIDRTQARVGLGERHNAMRDDAPFP